ncbi:hypothetical protein [Nocardia brasiliensis]|uniref:hypothetical protein n=1 Tax=Nocardia brasiliensis TaxID=37326 RepID=UPI003D8A240E
MSRTDLNRRIAALSGAVAVASGAGMLLAPIATAASGEITVTYPGGRPENDTFTLKNGELPCTAASKFGYGDEEITIINETNKTLTYYNGSSDCKKEGRVESATVAPGETARFYPQGNYELSFIVPPVK